MSISETVHLVADELRRASDEEEKKHLIKNYIMQETSLNKELLELMERVGVNEVLDNYAGLFQELSVDSYSLVLTMGWTSASVLNEGRVVNESDVKSIKDASKSNLEKKTLSSLYEFVVRKTGLLKKLDNADALDLPRISVSRRVSNIRRASEVLEFRLKHL